MTTLDRVHPVGTFRLSLALAATTIASANAHAQAPDMSRPVFIGDSLTAGYKDGSLHEDYQPVGFAPQIARQANTFLPLPLIAAPGIPPTLILVDIGPPPVIVQSTGQSTGRINPTVQAMNLGVPGHKAQDALTTRPDLAFDDLTDFVLGLPGLLQGRSYGQVEWAEALQPSIAFVWLGSMDALVAALGADSVYATPPADFAIAYAEVMQRMAATGAELVVANVPDVAAIPYLTSQAELAALLGVPAPILEAVLGVGPRDFVTPDAFPLIELILMQQMQGPLAPDVVFDGDEVHATREMIARYNVVIERAAVAYGATFVDIHALLEELDANGIVIDNQFLHTGFLGGIFSLDGIHPTETGYALIANEFIEALHQQAGPSFPPIDVGEIVRRELLPFPRADERAATAASLAGPAAASLRAVLVR